MIKVKNIVEALLLSSGEPMSADKLHKIINSKISCTKADVLESIDELKDDYETKEIEIFKVASGFRIQAKSSINDFLNIIYAEKTPRYSRALMETLSIIAYKQPVTRGDIEDIRGVTVNPQIIRNMIEFEWIKVVGHKETPGKPELLATTKKFLDHFNLKSLSDLPPPSELNMQ